MPTPKASLLLQKALPQQNTNCLPRSEGVRGSTVTHRKPVIDVNTVLIA
jgi:hypothetical protein